ncbi:MAG: 16S rRNA (adenine(1518)-N(6)/adenine(1519)-N(6))-dimethyltransferase RsmA [Spirochaetales bacterium]|nr:16S rRNA (adenine(1518)-N(6)/adenine(1519)-N(6))-dimethyltransferase RsmA [Spirochaetales bacterium]
MVNHNSVSEIRDLLDRRGIALKKRFGQNFLIDESFRSRIAEAVENAAGDGSSDSRRELWEIGPGLGSLTDRLTALPFPLRLFEIDRGIIDILRSRFGDEIPIEEGDFLDSLDRWVSAKARVSEGETAAGKDATRSFREEDVPIAIVGNLPYHSASAMIARIVEADLPVPAMVFLVQTELAQRLAAEVGRKEYSALSVLVQNHFRIRRVMDVPPAAFWPRPHVGSTVIRLSERSDRPSAADTMRLSRIARRAFAQRRKTLRNTLQSLVPLLERLDIDPGLRAERLSPEQYRALAREPGEAPSDRGTDSLRRAGDSSQAMP